MRVSRTLESVRDQVEEALNLAASDTAGANDTEPLARRQIECVEYPRDTNQMHRTGLGQQQQRNQKRSHRDLTGTTRDPPCRGNPRLDHRNETGSVDDALCAPDVSRVHSEPSSQDPQSGVDAGRKAR